MKWFSVEKLRELFSRCLYAYIVVFLFVAAGMSISRTSLESLPITFSAEIWIWKEELDSELLSMSKMFGLSRQYAVRVLTMAIRHSIRVYLNYFQALVVLITLTGLLKSWSKQLYIAAPLWMTDMTDNMISDMGRSFSADEGECPDLVVDSNFSRSKSISGSYDENGPPPAQHSLPTREASFSDEDVQRFHILSKKFLKGQPGWKNENLVSFLEGDEGEGEGEGAGKEEEFVFDSEFGVIPASSRALWRQQRTAGAEEREKVNKGASKRKLPPVRYSTSASNT